LEQDCKSFIAKFKKNDWLMAFFYENRRKNKSRERIYLWKWVVYNSTLLYKI